MSIATSYLQDPHHLCPSLPCQGVCPKSRRGAPKRRRETNIIHLQRKMLQDRLDGLVIPEAEAASLEEKHSLLLNMLDAVYLDLAERRSVVGILPKGPFYPLFLSLKDDPDAGVRVFDPDNGQGLLKEPLVNCGMVETGES